MDKTLRKRREKEGVSRDLRPSAAPLLGEDELIYRALQIAALRAERSVQQGTLTQDAASDIRHVLALVDGVKPSEEYVERAAQLANTYSLPEELTLTGVIKEIRALMEVGSLSEHGDQQRLFRLVPGLSGIQNPDPVLKALSFFKGRMFWPALRYLRDPDDPQRDTWLKEISDSAPIVQKGLERYLKDSTVAGAQLALSAALAQDRQRRV